MNIDELKLIISKQLSLENEAESSDHLATDLGLCSFDMMVMIVEIENICGHEINTALIKKDMTVNELLSLVNM